MRCSSRYIVGKEILICAEESELTPKCYFVRGIFGLLPEPMGIPWERIRRLTESQLL